MTARPKGYDALVSTASVSMSMPPNLRMLRDRLGLRSPWGVNSRPTAVVPAPSDTEMTSKVSATVRSVCVAGYFWCRDAFPVAQRQHDSADHRHQQDQTRRLEQKHIVRV